MKKLLKAIFAVIGAFAAAAAVNHLIFKLSERKSKLKTKEFFRKWTYGNVHYVKVGRGKPLLLLHGMSGGSGLFEWKKVITQLSRHYTVYAVDLPGFGFSDKPVLTYSSYLYSEFINDFIKNVIGEPAYVAANSNSASLTIAAYCLKPESYLKLLLISPVNGESQSAALPKKLFEAPIIGTTFYNIINSRIAIALRLKRYGYVNGKNITSAVVGQYHQAAHSGGIGVKMPLSALSAGFLDVDIERLISKATIPVHCVWGEYDELNPLCEFEAIHRQNENVTLAIFDDTKAFPHDENPNAFYKECRRFFG